MQVIKLTPETYFGAYLETEKVLAEDGVVIVPTDTVYGMLARADREQAVKKIFEIKKRSEKKPLPIFVKDIATARRYAYISDTKAKFLEKIWPGPVTVVFHHKSKLSPALTGGQETVGLRIPDYKFLLELMQKIDFPLAQTSANIAQNPPAHNLEDIKNYFSGEREKMIDLVLDAGEITGQPSMVLDFTGPKPLILRTGMMDKKILTSCSVQCYDFYVR